MILIIDSSRRRARCENRFKCFRTAASGQKRPLSDGLASVKVLDLLRAVARPI